MPVRKEPHPELVAIGQRIRTIRESKGLTLQGLSFEIDGAEAKMWKGMLSNIEHGRVNTSILTVIAIAKGLGVPVGTLVGEVDHGAT